MALLYEEYSPWKGAHFINRLKQIKETGKCPPVSLQIAPTNRCCSKCYYCYVKKNNENNQELKTETALNLIDQASELGVKAVEITGGGEPLIHHGIWKIISRITELKLDLGLITNGFKIIPEKISKATWVRFSIDSFNPVTYKKIRGVNMSDILDLNAVKAICQNKSITTGASCVVTPYNYNELFCFAKTAKEMGFSNVCFKPVELEVRCILVPYLETIKNEMKKIINLSDRNFKVFSLEMDLSSKKNTRKKFPLCLQQHIAMFVGADGNLYPCCSMQGGTKQAMGNICNGKLRDLWYSRQAIKLRDCNLACFWENKNIFLNYISSDNPRHVNFM